MYEWQVVLCEGRKFFHYGSALVSPIVDDIAHPNVGHLEASLEGRAGEVSIWSSLLAAIVAGGILAPEVV